jgi:peroxidase
LTNHLFRDETSGFGTDLASLNIQRGRDHGVPSYNAYREFCGLRRARNWNDLAGSFNNETLQKYIQTYSTPDDIDLWSAGVSERPLPGSMVGPVFGCIMGETFKNLRLGDRFWFENAGQPSSFTQGKKSKTKC